MAKKTKTIETEVSVNDFINSYVDNAQKKEDSVRLINANASNGLGLNLKCGDQLLLDLAVTIITMKVDIKVMPLSSASLREKLRFHFMSTHKRQKVRAFWRI